MKRLILAVIVLMFTLNVLGCQGLSSIPANNPLIETNKQLTMVEKLADFEYMYKILEENYPFFEVNRRLSGVDWLANKDKYINMINLAMTEQLYKEALDNILRDLNNGHTQIIDKAFYKFAKEAYETDKAMYGAWLEQLNNKSALLRYTDSESGVEQTNPQNDSTGDNIIPNNVQTKILIENKVAYLEISSFNFFNVEKDMEIIKPFLKSIKSYDALIIDIRQNGGGSSSYWSDNLVPMMIDKPISWDTYFVYRGGAFSEAFIKGKLLDHYEMLQPIEKLEEAVFPNAPHEILRDYKYYYKHEDVIKPKDSINFKGKIFLLVDEKVYSSSEMFASFARSTDFATLIGETTGGDGIGQDPMVCVLPNSGYIVRFPMVMGLTSDGTCNEEHKTEPNMKVNAKKDHNISKDDAIQYVLKYYK